jgi:flagellar hook-associated protein 1 FlgK
MPIASLEIGKRALIAQRFGLDVTSNNIANANTPGYSRRTATFSENTPYYTQGNFIGTGALVDKLRTYREEFFDREIRNTTSRHSGYEADRTVLTRLEAILNEPSENGLNEVTNKFLNAFDELAIKPENEAHRENVLGLGQTLVDRFNIAARQIQETRLETQNSLIDRVNTINKLVGEIVDLNKGVSSAMPLASTDAQTMIDKREERIEELSKLVGVTVTPGMEGMVNVYINGINVVTGPERTNIELEEQVNSNTNERTLVLLTKDNNGNRLNFVTPDSGEVQVMLKNYNVVLDEFDTSGNFSVASDMNKFVDSFVKKINSLVNKGFGLDDKSTTPAGRNFFEPSIGTITAGTISLSDDVRGKPRAIPMSDKPNEPGNSKIASQIARIADDTTFIGNQTPTEFYSGMVGRLGILSREAAHGLETTKLVKEQLTNQRETVIGVNLDEEAVNLIKFQQVFEAASRVVNTTNEILSTIVNLGR